MDLEGVGENETNKQVVFAHSSPFSSFSFPFLPFTPAGTQNQIFPLPHFAAVASENGEKKGERPTHSIAQRRSHDRKFEILQAFVHYTAVQTVILKRKIVVKRISTKITYRFLIVYSTWRFSRSKTFDFLEGEK